MSLIDLASMVLAPTAVKDGKVYNAIPNDQDFTFSRGTEATRVNSAGLIEKARTNYLLQSNTFDTTWIKSNASVTGGQTGYDGSSDAWLQQSTSTFCRLDQNITQTGILTLSAYAKAGTSNFLLLEVTRSGGVFYAWFDLSTGVVGTTSAIDANIESVGNGWYRCSLIGNQTLSGQVRLRVADSNGSTVTTTSSNIYIQDSQLEVGLVATDVITTTTSSVTVGITDDLPRVDYSGGGCPSLLLEPSRTNLVTNSEYFGASAWTKQEMTIASNSGIAPDGSLSATKVIPTTASSTHQIETGNIISSTQCAFSVFAKADGYDRFVILDQAVASNGATFYLSTETVVTIGTATATIENYGSGWYRCTIIANTTGMRIYIPNSSSAISGDGTSGVLLWGAQVEAGSYPTSYIPSYGTSTSRSADSLTSATLSLNLGYTAMIEMETLSTSDYNQIQFRQDTPSIVYALRIGNQVNVGGSTYVANNTTGQNKFALAVDTDGTYALYKNGTSISTGSGITANLQKITTDTSGQRVKQIILFPTRLTNDQLQDLTK